MNRRFMLIFLAALVVSGCVAMPLAEDARRNKALAAQVKAALIKAPQIDAAAIGVIADGGQIRLDGFVETVGESQRA
jgi:osmotically-inducible protein OsmY